MRTDGQGPEHSARLVEGVSLVWRRLLGLGLAARLAALAVCAGLLVVGYLGTPGNSPELAWVFGGRGFPQEKLATIRAVLSGGGIRRVVVEGRRVAVPADQLLVAQTALRKAKLDPRSLDEIVEGLSETRIFDDPKSNQVRVDRVRAAMAEHLIEQMPGIAEVKVHFVPLPPSGLSRIRAAKVVVDLKAEGADGRPSNRMVRDVRDLVLGVSDYVIKPEDVTLTGGGHQLLVAGDRTRLRKVLTAAREEDLAAEISTKLAEIGGVRVAVSLSSPAIRDWTHGGRPKINEPVRLEPEPSGTTDAEAVAESTQAKVAIGVPRSHYRRSGEGPLRDLESSESRQAEARVRTVTRIDEVVRAILPPEQLAELTIEELDDPAEARPSTPDRPTTKLTTNWWIPATAGSVLAAAAVFVTLRRRSTSGPEPRPQRPSRRSTRQPDPAHVHGHTHGPGSAERVRDLVRRNPEVAAGVLRRWVGQEGSDS